MEPWLVLYFDHCNTDAVLYQLSYQAIWELVILWVRNIFFLANSRLAFAPPLNSVASNENKNLWHPD